MPFLQRAASLLGAPHEAAPAVKARTCPVVRPWSCRPGTMLMRFPERGRAASGAPPPKPPRWQKPGRAPVARPSSAPSRSAT